MTKEEIFNNLCQYVIQNVLTYEEYQNIFYKWVEEHYAPIPKSELEIGKEYPGVCRNASKAVWDGTRFEYDMYKCKDHINHYEDDNGLDVFVPVKEIVYE